MSIFGDIVGKIFPKTHPAVVNAASQASAAPSAPAPAATRAAAPAPVDINAVLTKMEQSKDENLNWQNSIVDLMKLLGLDSGLSARKQLAKELNYTGDMNDSASMNIWLHQEVMNKLAENGGIVPNELKH